MLLRFETPAGRQGQVDFAAFTLPWGRRYAMVMVLSCSRLLWLRFYRRRTMAVLIEGLERCERHVLPIRHAEAGATSRPSSRHSPAASCRHAPRQKSTIVKKRPPV